MASIRKRMRKDGSASYRVEVRLKGFPPQRATFHRLTDAKRWVQDTESAIRDRRYFKTAQARKHTLAELIDKYVGDVLPTMPKARNREQQLGWWRASIGAHTLADIEPTMIADYRSKLLTQVNSKGVVRSPATVNRYMAAISHALTVAVTDWGWLEANPMRNVKRCQEPEGRVRFLSEDNDGIEGELTRLLRACKVSGNAYLYPVVVLAVATGMRKGEIMALTWGDVDLRQGRILLTNTKNGERRVVPIGGKALTVLKEHAQVRRIDTPLLFPSRNKPDKPIDLRKPFSVALKEAGIEDFRFHDLRHSTASYLTMNGATAIEVAALLGHKTLQMTKRYAHLSEAHSAAVVGGLDKRLFGDE